MPPGSLACEKFIPLCLRALAVVIVNNLNLRIIYNFKAIFPKTSTQVRVFEIHKKLLIK